MSTSHSFTDINLIWDYWELGYEKKKCEKYGEDESDDETK